MDYVRQWNECEGNLKRIPSLIKLLESRDPASQLRAAKELVTLGRATRGSIRPRGTLRRASLNRLPSLSPQSSAAAEQVLLQSLSEGTGELCKELIRACSEWGGDKSIEFIVRLLRRSDAHVETKLSCVGALRTLGGPLATATLEAIQNNGESEQVLRRAAVRGLQDLRTGGSVDDFAQEPDWDVDEFTPKAQILDKIGSVPMLKRVVEGLDAEVKSVSERMLQFRSLFEPARRAYPEINWEAGIDALLAEHSWPKWVDDAMSTKLGKDCDLSLKSHVGRRTGVSTICRATTNRAILKSGPMSRPTSRRENSAATINIPLELTNWSEAIEFATEQDCIWGGVQGRIIYKTRNGRRLIDKLAGRSEN